jgi:outer membrane protein assembly factor BamA
LVLLIAALNLLNSCSVTKTVPEGEHLLMKNKIKTTPYNKSIPNVTGQIRLIPNRKILGITRFHLKLYNLGTSLKDSTKNDKRIRAYLRRAGEEPVLFDSSEVRKSASNIQQFLFNHGYFFAKVEYEVKYGKKKVKKLTYHVYPGEYFTVSEVQIISEDTSILSELSDIEQQSLIKVGKRIDFENIGKERNRIFMEMRKRGYYQFKRDYVDFVIDTVHQEHKAKITLKVSGNEQSVQHKKYYYDSIFFVINAPFFFDSKKTESITYDSLIFYMNNFPLNPSIVASKNFLRPNELFNQRYVDLTSARISELGVFDNGEVEYKVKSTNLDSNKLNVIFKLRPAMLQTFSIEPQAITSDQNNQIASTGNFRNYGLANVITYSHRNIFHNAERLDLSFTTRAETQFKSDLQKERFFSNFQVGVNATLFLPRSSIWKRYEMKKSEAGLGMRSVRSLISTSFIYENNLDFNRRIIPIAYTWQFIKPKSSWFITPVELLFSNSTITPGFLDKVNPRDVDFIKRLFSSNIISSSSLRWNYANFDIGSSPKDYFAIRTNVIEPGGNTHRLVRRAIDTENQADTSYKLFNVTYFQFLKSEVDMRYGREIDVNNAIAFRLNIGAAYPYGNESIVPFDKRFFIGGSNSLRGWRPRTVGPGSYRDTASGTRIDRSGELLIQGSVEYRFKFIGPLESAIFVDAGNVWNIRRDANHSDLEMFNFQRFFPDLAINTGLGLRFDLNFLMLRLDWGIQLKDPEIIEYNGWVAREIGRRGWLSNTVLNLGIGYPF